MHDRLWLFLATLGYLASAGWGLYALGSQRPLANRWTFLLIAAAFALHTLFLHQRGEAIGHCPITNLFETLAFFSWSLVLTYLVVGPAYRMSILGAFTAPVVFLINFFALARIRSICPSTLPHLGWQLELHATLALLGLGVLGVAALAGVAYLIQERQLKRHVLTSWFYTLPNVGRLELVQQRVLVWGFLDFFRGRASRFFHPAPRSGRLGEDRLVGGGLVPLRRAGHRAGPRPAESQEDRAAFRGGLRFHPADVLGDQFPERSACLSARRLK